ncbi:MAG TPA: DUF2125 domain-containing protein [Alphaproteobacteria bacterium]|nr:DUF2125 domain-containing protein [Alphaproteobacteria bacterium]HNS45308.1 DUF2125 domain-containing protein [Alphaproteobacteria bacterium]
MKKFLKVVGGIILGAALLVSAIYSAMWFLVAKNVRAHIDAFWANLPQMENVVIVGEKPKVTGFPGPPQVKFSGVVTVDPGIAFNIPELQIIGFPLSGLTLYFELPHGMDVSMISGEMKGMHVDFAAANISLPQYPPLQASYSEIKEWQTLEDPMIVNGFDARMGDIRIQGRGILGVDEDLQPDLRLESRVDGMNALFDRLAENTKVDPRGLETAKGFLKMVSKVDPATNLPYFETGFYIQHRGLFIGPMRLYNFEEIIWPGTPKENLLSRKRLR